MESAIPTGLRCPRSQPARMAEGYEPPSPAWTARWPAAVKQVVMAYFGVQAAPGSAPGTGFDATREILRQLRSGDAPAHDDVLHYVDEAGHPTYVVVAYWHDPEAYGRWLASDEVRAWWHSPQRLDDGLGYFREVYSPKIEDFETLSSTPGTREGVANLSERFSGEVREHAYWGGARDRLPVSQTETLEAVGVLRAEDVEPGRGRRVRLSGHANLALIRSGQNWAQTRGSERDFYLDKLEPVLRRGMDFLRDDGVAQGCYFNRYMRHVDAAGHPIEKSLGLSAWRSLGHLEEWAESHPTHKAIFGSFLHLLDSKTSPPDLRLYHEVTVVKKEAQDFEYLNCHARTGLLRAVEPVAPSGAPA